MTIKANSTAILNCYAYYAYLSEPRFMYERVSEDGVEQKEYTVQLLITEEDYKILKKRYPSVKAIKNVVELTASEFETKFKIGVPYETEDDTYYLLKLTKAAQYKDGNPIPEARKPKVAFADRKPFTGLIGNGSEVHVQFSERTWTFKGNKGLSLDINKVGIVNLIEYVADDQAEWEDGAEEPSQENNQDDDKDW